MAECVVGVPREQKTQEGRVGMTPAGVWVVTQLGGRVLVEHDAGVLSGFSDQAYKDLGAIIVETSDEIWKNADIVVKIKEPIKSEYPHLRSFAGRTLFTYLHLAGGAIDLTRTLLDNKITAIAYETVSLPGKDNRAVFPLLVPMSQIAGTQAMHGALARHQPEHHQDLSVVIIGGGNVGEAALCRAVCGVGSIVIFEAWEKRILELKKEYGRIEKVKIFPLTMLDDKSVRKYLKEADIVISGPMLPGGKEAPIVLTQKHFRIMKQGCYIADVSIDQGGSTAWTKGNPTKPGETFTRGARKLVFSAVPNIPGSTVPAEATLALTDTTLPYVLVLVSESLRSKGGEYTALRDNTDLRKGLQTYNGYVTNEHVAAHHDLSKEYRSPDSFF
ncbi:MAG: hypothetical protein A2845_05715 [Candidatus Lloydbacteria bacterium RIFCSPHIGHO2_01_FULL_49_22]|uniref:Uncharacterized protein n=1 Tax=Candidatus Lloydbacteria bacterium RIFCSPHIGHO2_01_FULL_49_22 TaxID=1798658 RepID=A0A1G2CVV6_9BACT|nr:MAG: hypothetical protein A2845_05715 [Candidatus Lloydbacteria bacterium RIFCSPHIGHO2_01_FULL_49_22]OGZ09817.1 MAG: hypothetical protein A3C14_00300 [Candidatus Lloydbacteria bacterium RIFCSPHIGHO2_02_FULL_50_18]